jgi:hypothetical protein
MSEALQKRREERRLRREQRMRAAAAGSDGHGEWDAESVSSMDSGLSGPSQSRSELDSDWGSDDENARQQVPCRRLSVLFSRHVCHRAHRHSVTKWHDAPATLRHSL